MEDTVLSMEGDGFHAATFGLPLELQGTVQFFFSGFRKLCNEYHADETFVEAAQHLFVESLLKAFPWESMKPPAPVVDLLPCNENELQEEDKKGESEHALKYEFITEPHICVDPNSFVETFSEPMRKRSTRGSLSARPPSPKQLRKQKRTRTRREVKLKVVKPKDKSTDDEAETAEEEVDSIGEDAGMGDEHLDDESEEEEHLKSSKPGAKKRKIDSKFTRTRGRDRLCYICGKFFKSPCYLRRHMGQHHNIGRQEFICEICGKSFSDKFKCKDHARIHDPEAAYICDMCGKKFYSKQNFKEHKETHQGVTYTCTACPKAFVTPKRLKEHQDRMHGNNLESKVLVSCPECGKQLKNANTLKTHLLTTHGEKPFGCAVCGKRFVSRALLQYHSVVHTDDMPYSCTTCGKSYKSRWSYHQHKEVAHSANARRHTCPVCHESFSYSGSLANHKKYRHPEFLTGRAAVSVQPQLPQY